jgi:hypothetical protein
MSRALGRRRRSGQRVLFFCMAVVASPSLGAEPAKATSSSECIEANKKGQSLRRTGKFEDARAEFERCGDPKCPALVVADCVSRQAELEQAQPTVVLQVSDSSGQDLIDVAVKVDDAPLTKTIEGKELRVDPGRHVFTFQAPGTTPLARTVVIAEHEKGRLERVVLASAKVAAGDKPPEPLASAPRSGDENAASRRHAATTTVLAFTAMGIGLAGVAVGGVFGGLTFVESSAQKRDCLSAAACPNYAAATSDHSNAVFDGTLANVALVSGAALLALGAVLFLTKPHVDVPAGASAHAWIVVPMIGPSAGILAATRF